MYCRMNRVECSYANTNGYCDSSACHNMNVVGNILPKERPENISNSSIWVKPQSNWHTGTPKETGEYLVCIRYDFGKEGYTTANYVEPFNPHTGWYNLKPPSEEDGHEWCKKNGIEVIAWQKIEPYKED